MLFCESADLPEDQREVSKADGEELCKNLSIPFFETGAVSIAFFVSIEIFEDDSLALAIPIKNTKKIESCC